MADLWEDETPDTGSNAPEFTVSEISGAVKRTIEGEFGRVRVRGELGRISTPRSGHVYLDLKDDRSVLSGVIWKGNAARLATRPEEGMEVVATGRLTTFPGQSKYQMVIDDLTPAGAGALMAMLEKRKAQLAAEGLFAQDRKRPLPYLPRVIGVVTSPSGAVIRDILHRLRDRFPVHVLVWPVAVQGAACAADVARAIRGFNAIAPGGPVPRPDVLIVARGGGSIEDLWGFNEEVVVRAAADSAIPLISAVGHETDTTLIDFAADRRAPTPTAAAEMAVPVRRDLSAVLDGLAARLAAAQARLIGQRQQRLRDLARALPRAEALTEGPRQRLDAWGDRLPGALRLLARSKRTRLAAAAGALRPATLAGRLADRRTAVAGLAARAGAAEARGRMLRAERLASRADRLGTETARGLRQARRDLAPAAARLDRIDPAARLPAAATALDGLAARLAAGWQTAIRLRSDRLAQAERLRQGFGYRQTLRRGFAVVRGAEGVVTTAAEAAAEARLELEFHDGRLALGAASGPAGGDAPAAEPAQPRRKGARSKPPEQGSLF